MLPKSLRLQGRGAFEAVFREKKAIFGAEIGLFYRPNNLSRVRVGFAFKQKSFPRSATRHFLKRKGSVIMGEFVPELKTDLDIIILFHKPFSDPITYSGLKDTLYYLVKRLNQAKI